VAGIVIPVVLALAASSLDIGVLVGWAFAIAASSFCPVFLLGIWWRGLTRRGAAIGMVAGAGEATGGNIAGLAIGEVSGAAGALLSQPAVVSVPLAFAAMIVISLLDSPDRPAAEHAMLVLHAPEGLGLEQLEHGPARTTPEPLEPPPATRAPVPRV
jgi:Na+(H+)/acetate symporter ActP